MLSEKEEGLQLMVVDFLEVLLNQGKIMFYTHINNNMYTNSFKQKSKARRMGVKSGTPDILVITNAGLVLLFELKAPKGVLSDSQKQLFQDYKNKGKFSFLHLIKGKTNEEAFELFQKILYASMAF